MNKTLSALVAGIVFLSGVFTDVVRAELPVPGINAQVVTGSPTAPNVSVQLIADTTAIEPGKPFRIAADITLAPGWHIYYKEPGDSGMPTNVELVLPAGYQIVKVEWEKPTRFEESGFTTYGYTGKTVISITVMPPANVQAGDSIAISAKVSWLACKDSCMPGDTTSDITLPVASSTVLATADHQDRFKNVGFTGDVTQIGKPGTSIFDQDIKPNDGGDSDRSLLTYLFFALVGGALLNFMPCVLPVISLKVVRFINEAGESKAQAVRLAVAYTVGTVSTFVALALVVILAKGFGYSVGWGFQFQEPLFLVGMAALLTVMSLGLFGVFFLNVNSGKGLDNLASRKGLSGAFFTGVVATILSTPCTAPFLGSAIGFAFAQPWWVIIAVFSTVGFGLSGPYVLLCLIPGTKKLLPKPGAWMEHFKEAMGFLLLVSVIWLLSVLGKQTGPDGVVATVAFLVAASFGTWLYNRLAGFDATRKRKLTVGAIALAIAGATMYYVTLPAVNGAKWVNTSTTNSTNHGGIAWEPFSKEAVDKALQEGKVVFIDFTAAWCQTCQVNEATVLSSDAVAQAMKQKDVVTLKADWTNRDAVIREVLSKFGKAGVPLYVIISPKRPTEPIVLPTILTTQTVIDGLEEASRP